MNTQPHFYKSAGRLGEVKTHSLMEQSRVKTSSSPTRMPAIKDMNPGKSKFNSSSSPAVTSNYNIQNLKIMDPDKLQEELIKAKSELNRKVKELHSLKILYIKLDNENKRNVRIIEEVLDEATRLRALNNSKDRNLEDESNIKNLIANTYFSDFTLNKLKEVNNFY
jgi:hypothetical protein